MRPIRIIAPASPLIPVADLRDQFKADTDEQDAQLQAYEQAAVDYLDGYTGRLGRCILRQKWALPLIGDPDAVLLPFPDCREFAIEQLTNGAWAEVHGVTITQMDDYALFEGLPNDQDGLHLTCFAGWETAGDVPNNLKQAVRMLVAHWNGVGRSAVTVGGTASEVPLGVDAMLQPLIHIFV